MSFTLIFLSYAAEITFYLMVFVKAIIEPLSYIGTYERILRKVATALEQIIKYLNLFVFGYLCSLPPSKWQAIKFSMQSSQPAIFQGFLSPNCSFRKPPRLVSRSTAHGMNA